MNHGHGYRDIESLPVRSVLSDRGLVLQVVAAFFGVVASDVTRIPFSGVWTGYLHILWTLKRLCSVSNLSSRFLSFIIFDV